MIELKWKIKHTDFQTVSPPGSDPGTLISLPDATPTLIRAMSFGEDGFVEKMIENLSDIKDLIGKWPVTWIDVRGFQDIEKVGELGNICNIHRLALEDVVGMHQRPKVEEYDNNLFIVIRMLELADEVLSLDQLSMFISSKYIVTFQATEEDNLDPVRSRIRKERSRIRKSGPDYLAYSIIDTVIDSYFPALEGYEERIEALEDRILSGTQSGQLAEIHEIKRDLLLLRRNIWPVREALASLLRESYPAISEETRLYLRDCYDHAIRIIDLIENYRQIAADLMDLYLSMVSNRMNEIMKVLTVISTIFIPPTFVAGIYGMNFNTEVSPLNMPELNMYFGYPACLSVMLVMTLSVIIFLISRGWLGSK